jgi:hypothetical protein
MYNNGIKVNEVPHEVHAVSGYKAHMDQNEITPIGLVYCQHQI